MPTDSLDAASSRSWLALVYALALAAGAVVVWMLPGGPPILVGGVANVAATLVVFGFSRWFDNSSVFDPYWSVMPLPMAAWWGFAGEGDGDPWRYALVMLLIGLWAGRLTGNFLRGWPGMAHEDWRYVDLRVRFGPSYWLVSALGIHLFPAVLVWMGLFPVYALANNGRGLGCLDLFAFVICVAGILLEATADEQLREFKSRRPPAGSICTDGVWGWSRHPNYLGEILFWVGLAAFGLAAGLSNCWAIGGAIAMVLLFSFVSIPMMERRMQARRPAWSEHVEQVPKLLPRPPR